LDRAFDPVLAKRRESLLRDVLDRGPEANDLLLLRLQKSQRGLEAGLDLAKLLLTRERHEEAAAELARILPPELQLTRPQAQAASGLMAELITAALHPDADAGAVRAAEDMLQLFVDQDRVLAPQVLAQRVYIMARRPDRTPRQIVEAAERTALADPDNKLTRLADALRALRQQDRRADLVEASTLLSRAHPDNDLLLDQRLASVANLRDADAAVAFALEQLSDAEALRLAKYRRIDPEAVGGMGGVRTELLYHTGIELRVAGHAEASRRVYRAVLERDDAHGMAANNLGYDLLESGDLAGAEPLLELAAEREPASPNVLDSIGWLRYRQGRFADTPRVNGPDVPGARTWLLRAVERPEGAANGVLLDHLADTHYRLGELDLAGIRWKQAEARVRDSLRLLRQRGNAARVAEMARRQQNIAEKLAALDRGAPAPVAPIAEEDPAGDEAEDADGGEPPQ
ncbi:MAG: hypothetical protein AAGK04_06950, partial [Planctomycetota bacterium]